MKTASTANGVTTTLLDQKGYDPRGRLIREWHSINGGTPVLVSNTTYDEIERMSQNALGNGVVTTDFTYDIQNRLRKINDPANLGTKPFALELQYNAPNVTGSTAQYAGNISAARWKHLSGSEQTYYYNYDSYSRLTSGVHGGGNSEQSIGYDSNGNISALTRTGAQAAGLSYSYSGNRLTTLTKDGTGYTYAYDSNGNITTEGLRGMTISYNYLNLPKSVTKNTDNLEYIYDAEGNKLAEKFNGMVNNYYTGAVVYKADKTVDYIPASTGLISKVGSDFVRQYNINDHLGNTRSVVSQTGTIEQATDYYPYGLAFNYNNLDKNRYLYNGKELQNQTLSTTFFGMYDYGARYYDPVIGRWNSVDPMAESYYSQSPYHFSGNNPIRFLDLNGMNYGDYYNDNGTWLGSDGTDDDKVYMASSVTKNDKGLVTSAKNSQKLPISHREFRKQSSTVYGESSAYKMNTLTDDLKNEMFAIASVHQKNSLSFGTNSPKANEYLALTPEAINESEFKRTANAAVINAVTGGFDYSYGATMWDGREQALFPSIDNRRSTGEFELHMNTMGWNISDSHFKTWKTNIGTSFQAPQKKVAPTNFGNYQNKGLMRLQSTAVYGETIFWKIK